MRRSNTCRRVAASLVVGCLVAIALAQPVVYPDAWSDTPAVDVVRGGVLYLATAGDPRTFNPLVSEEVNVIASFITGGAALGWIPPGSIEMEPYAAATFDVSPDGLVIDAVLRDALRWSDGAPITVADYLISHELQSDPATGGSRVSGWFIDGEPIVVEATGDRSLRITLPSADRFGSGVLGMLWPLPDRIFGTAWREGGGDAVNALWGIETDPADLVFSGMMRLVQFTPGERIAFERNPHWGDWNVDASGAPLPYLDGLTFRVTESSDTALNLFLAGEVDVIDPQSLDDVGIIRRAVLNGDLEATVLESIYPTTANTFLAFNWNLASDPFKESLLRDVRFRRAVAHLIDRDTIVELVFGGAGFPLYNSVHPTETAWAHPALDVPAFDPEQAVALLAEIGFDRRDGQGYLIDAEGRRAGFSVVTNAENVARVQMMTLLADIAREVGVDIQTQAVAFPLLVDTVLAAGDDRPFEVVLIGLTGATGSPWPFGEATNRCDEVLHLYNKSGECIDAIEARIEALTLEGRRTLDTDAAIAIGHEIQALEAELGTVIYLAGRAVHHAATPRLRGYFPADLVGVHEGLMLQALRSLR
jgi:peptide/nickel transport system substrate-binding protein